MRYKLANISLAKLSIMTISAIFLGACAVAGDMLQSRGDGVQQSAAGGFGLDGEYSAFSEGQGPLSAGAPATLLNINHERGTPGVVRIGLLVPLTGERASIGRDLLDAAQISLFDVAGDNLQLLPYDTNGSPGGASRAAQRALSDGVQLILGPLLSGSVAAVAPVARSRGVPVVAFSNDVTVAGRGVYTMGFVPQDQVRRVVDFARNSGLTRFAGLIPNSSYGVAMADALRGATSRFGADLTEIKFYRFDEDGPENSITGAPVTVANRAVRELADFDRRVRALDRKKSQLEANGSEQALAELARLERLQTEAGPSFDAVLLPAGGTDVLRLAPLLAFYDVDPSNARLLGTWLWDDPSLGAEPTMVGAWYAAPPPQSREKFLEKFRDTYGRDPDRRATLAYDGLAMAAILANRTPSGRPFSQRDMTVNSGFVGTDGIFRLLPSGLVQRGLAVLQIERDGVTVVDPAPRNFNEMQVIEGRGRFDIRRRRVNERLIR